ncbi:Zn(II)2Cys6 transcription factor [Pochonia chlamydosporia 170]|uniref:Zn(II)2Cys6 transcription factor n=1 Tax=Pochonia chlamydosporia 170 TaxID=1380566 RepID=A0A179F5H5_METCM|nr:Zn(II)2Cys6 transcription factor [Pochonia chlamydosporia 170]OAQ60369.1 Zn(II)2Cys6 transcription factor [Pochonia chlamydosporia 170]
MPWWNVGEERGEQLFDLLVPKENLLAMGRLYLTWCHGQPISLFNPDIFLESLTFRDLELILALQTLSLRYPPSTLTPQKRERLDSMEKEARSAVMSRIASSEAELSTLQTLCILSMVEFADGKVAQAGLHVAIASQLAQSVQPNNMLGDAQEFNDCVHSIVMLQNLQGCIPPSTGPGSALSGTTTPSISQIRAAALSGIEPPVLPSVPSLGYSQMDSGIMKYALELSEAWRMARAYAASRVAADALPPWNQHSDYSSIMHLHLEFDCRVPLKYRFAANKFAEQDQDSLEQRRDYWGPWLFIQIVYAVIPCILNHPFLLSMRLKNFRYTIPQSFIHHSFEYINRHAGWIMYFINLLEKKSFYISDPSLAHCIAIVATIHLQHSFVKDKALRDKAQQGFEKCMGFLRRMGGTWPCVSIMANNLDKLRESVGEIRSPNSLDDEFLGGRRSFSIDGQLLWDILIYERAGRPDAGADQSIFGKTLKVGSKSREDDVRTSAEFDLVGSAGISGHKAVSKETPAYAPNEDMPPTPRVLENIEEMDESTPVMGVSVEDRFFEGIGGLDGQEHLFLQANDFGKAIDNWLSFDSF